MFLYQSVKMFTLLLLLISVGGLPSVGRWGVLASNGGVQVPRGLAHERVKDGV